MRISVIGAGYLGLVTSVGLAEIGHVVTCVDSDGLIVDKINSGTAHFYEPGLDEKLGKHIGAKTLSASLDLKNSVLGSEATMVCVGSPMAANGGIDLSHVEKAVGQIGESLRLKNGYHLVIVKSTVVPGSSEKIAAMLWKTAGKPAKQIGVCMNPEFIREGSALEDFLNPDRIVIGQSDQEAGTLALKIYERFNVPVIRTNLRTAELIKYASNAFLAVMISFSNEMAGISEAVGDTDIREVMLGVILDRRITTRMGDQLVTPGMIAYLKAGCGFGGSCLPKDLNALRHEARERGCETTLLESALEVNRKQTVKTVNLLTGAIDVRGKNITVLGVAYKPDTDDVRESPAFVMVDLLLKAGASVRLCDPCAVENAKKLLGENVPGVSYYTDPKPALSGSHGAILVTPWPQFANLRPEDFAEWMANPLLIDGRGVYDRKSFINKLDYRAIGYKPQAGNHILSITSDKTGSGERCR